MDSETREYLISAFRQLHAHRAAISSLLAEVSSVRDSLIELGPKYKEILDCHRVIHIRASGELVAADLRTIDELIQKLRALT